MISLLLTLSIMLDGGTSIQLEKNPTVPYITGTRIQISPWSDGTFLFNDHKRLLEFSLKDGSLLLEVDLRKLAGPVDLSDFWIASMGVLPREKDRETLYVMSLLARGKDGELTKRVAVFDFRGVFLGFGVDPRLNGSLENYYHQYITLPFSNRLVVNNWSQNSRYGNERRILREVDVLEKPDGNFAFVFSGEAFWRKIEEKKSLGSAFRDYWLVERENKLFAMEETANRILLFEEESLGKVKLQANYTVPYGDRNEPYPYPEGRDISKQTWYHSFDRTTGLYDTRKYHDGLFLMSWESPNPDFFTEGPLTKPDGLDLSNPPFILNFILVDENGNPSSSKKSLPGSRWCIGVHEEKVFTLVQNSSDQKNYTTIEATPLKDLFK